MKHHLVIIYHSFNDPIFKGLMLKYIQKFQEAERDHTFHVVTFEQSAYSISDNLTLSYQKTLYEHHLIDWIPIKYHTGGAFILLKKIWDVLSVLLISIRIHRKISLYRIIGFTTISGSISYLLSKILRIPLVLLNIEPHSEYMVDFGYWKKNNLKYIILKFLEKKQMQHAAYLAVPTQNAFVVLKDDYKIKEHLYFVPTCINIEDFSYKPESRLLIREKIAAIENTIVLIYLGKFGGIYFTIDQMAKTFKDLVEENNDLLLYIITPDSIEEIQQIFNDYGLEKHYYVQKRIQYEEISDHLSASDIGIVFIPSYPSQLFRCPIKTANYLACGLPYLITKNIGDDSKLAEELDIGFIMNGDTSNNFSEQFKNKNFDRIKLRKIAYNLRDLELVLNFMKFSLK